MNIACIAHDKKKDDLVAFMTAYEHIFSGHTLYATGTTGKRIMEATSLKLHAFQSGPLGGDQQIGAMIAEDSMDAVLFFRDPLTAQPHEPDINALIRLSDVYSIPLATNMATAEILVNALKRGELEWRRVISERSKGDQHD
ncbi:methylglyoxal synthase [Bacillus daqingensis]|uniref:Methylglyoxal synthase n=1 Tax=Bacillus daqingensis TaxID=872396 RepID=A0ABV9NRH2_9BACI